MGSASGIRGAAQATGQIRRCRHTAEFTLVRTFAGCEIWQCQQCRKTTTVITRPVKQKSCLACGQALRGRQRRWCGASCEQFYAAHISRSLWVKFVKRRAKRTCQRCGWKATRLMTAAFNTIRTQIKQQHRRWSVLKIYHEGCRQSGFRMLEAHHVVPLEQEGAELDVENGLCLCHLCHDQIHRELRAT